MLARWRGARRPLALPFRGDTARHDHAAHCSRKCRTAQVCGRASEASERLLARVSIRVFHTAARRHHRARDAVTLPDAAATAGDQRYDVGSSVSERIVPLAPPR